MGSCILLCDSDSEEDTSSEEPVAAQNLLRGSSEGPLIICRVLASGGFGKVLDCSVQGTTARYAVKTLSTGCRAAVYGELLVMGTQLCHSNIVRIFECFEDRKKECLCVRMQLCEGRELFSLCGVLKNQVLIEIYVGLSRGLHHMHQRQLVHRDCKPENILLHRSAPILVDMGTTRRAGNRARVQGTLAYMAPEATRRWGGTHLVSPALDAWSLGVTLCASVLRDCVQDAQEALRRARRLGADRGAFVEMAALFLVVNPARRPPILCLWPRLSGHGTSGLAQAAQAGW